MNDTILPHFVFRLARDDLQRAGIKLEIAPGGYRVNGVGAPLESAFFAEDLADAITAGKELAASATLRLAPLGPTGRRNSRRSLMYRHNRRIAAIRRRRKARP